MNADELRGIQAPLKEHYKTDPEAALVTLTAWGELDGKGIACRVDTGHALIKAGLHPATGGTGEMACSGNMLLDALAACAGVTLKAVAVALGFDLKGGSVSVEGDLDFRGTLGVSREAPVGFRAIRVRFELVTSEPQERIDTLTRLTERYCVVLQSLARPPALSFSVSSR